MVYLDYSATTRVDERVLEVYNKVSTNYFANSNSLHKLGTESKKLENYATKKIAKLLGVKETEIIYTSGSSESNNLAIKGTCFKYQNRGKHIITTYLEHSSILETVNYLQKFGFTIDYVKIKDDGTVDLDNLRSLLRDDTILVSVCAIDSELGIKQPINEIGEILKNYPKCIYHVDCTQGIGKIKINYNNIDLASISGHKIYGPLGIGILIKKENIEIDPLINGGKSTTVYRSGTPSLPLIVSIMKALELIIPNIETNYNYIKSLQKEVLNFLNNYSSIHINSTNNSIPHIINFSINKVKPETFLHSLEQQDIYISTKSACSSNDTMSTAVYAVTKNREYANTSLRISLSYLTTKDEIEIFKKAFDKTYKELVNNISINK